jgi:tRNA uridine 5-carboxymethylaminomethyl modification enzyme
LAKTRELLGTVKIRKGDPSYAALRDLTGQELGESITLGQLALRPNVKAEHVKEHLPAPTRTEVSMRDIETALADYLYAGYLETQGQAARRIHQHDSMTIPANLSFKSIASLSHEMVERLERVRPQNFGQARQIPGLTAAALSTLLVYLSSHRQPALPSS